MTEEEVFIVNFYDYVTLALDSWAKGMSKDQIVLELGSDERFYIFRGSHDSLATYVQTKWGQDFVVLTFINWVNRIREQYDKG